jgi:hypothetical protein
MKVFLRVRGCVLGMALISSGSFAAEKKCEFDAATYKGKGEWKNFADDKGVYEVTTEFKGTEVESVYDLGDGKEFRVTLTLAVEDGKCSVSVEASDKNKKGGSGYCNEYGCSYRVKGDDLRLEENFMLKEGHLYRIGFRVHPSLGDKGIISWAEKLPKI